MTTAIRGNSLYAIIDDSSWSNAETQSQSLGGHLVTINSASENSFLRDSVLSQRPDNQFWIGINDPTTEGVFLWSSGESVSYTNWSPGEPSGNNGFGEEDYGIMYAYNAGANSAKWNDGINGEVLNGVTYDFFGIAEIPLTLSVTRSGTPQEGAGVFTTSINLSAGTTSNLANGTTVYWTVSGITSDDLASGSLTGSGTISGGKLDIQHSLTSDADSGENFEVSVYSDSARTLQIGTTSSVAIQEAPAPGGGGGGGSSSSTPTTTPAANPETSGTTATTTSATTTGASVTPTPSAESPVLGIPPQASVQTIQLSTPVTFGSLAVSQAIVGTNQNDIIIGTDAAEALTGGQGKDRLTGGVGPDAFIFETPNEFGKKSADVITDCNPDEGDKIVISSDAFGGVTKIKFTTVTGKKEAKQAGKSKSNFIYDDKKGMLYYDANGKKNNFGDGGEFAQLLGSPDISKSDFIVM